MRRPSLTTLTIMLCLLVLTSMATSVHAQKTVDSTPPEEVVGAMSNKLVRGVANVFTGWLELPKQIVVTFKEEGAVKGIFVGPLKGIGMTVVRTVSGAGEVVTFYAPFPGFYDPYFAPEYVWQGWEGKKPKQIPTEEPRKE